MSFQRVLLKHEPNVLHHAYDPRGECKEALFPHRPLLPLEDMVGTSEPYQRLETELNNIFRLRASIHDVAACTLHVDMNEGSTDKLRYSGVTFGAGCRRLCKESLNL